MRFKEYGLEMFEVVDNGSGIPPEDYDSIGECLGIAQGMGQS